MTSPKSVSSWVRLGNLWTRHESEQDGATFLRLDKRALKESGITYDQALQTLKAVIASDSPLPNSARAGDAHQVLALKADEARQVIRIKVRWIKRTVAS